MRTITYRFKDIEPEDYGRDEVTAHQKAKLASLVYGTPDPDVEEVVTEQSGSVNVYDYEVQPDGAVERRLKPSKDGDAIPAHDSNQEAA